MKLTVNDFFEAYYSETPAQEPSAERIKVLTMKKIENGKGMGRPIRKTARVAIAAVVIFVLTVTVYAASNWTGFVPTGSMSQEEIKELMVQIEESGCVESIDKDGTVHYFDSNGNEFMVLSPEEAILFEQARQEQHEKQNEENARNLLDLKTLSFTPRSVTPIATYSNGSFDDFLLGNGSLVILYAEDTQGYELRAGDTVTISMNATDTCIMEFGMVRAGRLIESENIRHQTFEKTFTVPKDGTYCFTLTYFSSDSDNFTDCSIHIE